MSQSIQTRCVKRTTRDLNLEIKWQSLETGQAYNQVRDQQERQELGRRALDCVCEPSLGTQGSIHGGQVSGLSSRWLLWNPKSTMQNGEGVHVTTVQEQVGCEKQVACSWAPWPESWGDRKNDILQVVESSCFLLLYMLTDHHDSCYKK